MAEIIIPQITPEMIAGLLAKLEAINSMPVDMVVILVARNGGPPVLTGTLHPEEMDHLFRFLLEHSSESKVSEHWVENPNFKKD